MTKITFLRRNGVFWGFRESGHTGFGEEGGKSFRAPLHVGFMLRLSAHGRDPEQGEQFAKEPVLVVHDVLFHLYGD